MEQCSSGRLTLFLSAGQVDEHVLPSRPDSIPGLVPVDAEEFYESMNHIGLDYTGKFRKMENICRSRNYTTSSTMKPPTGQDYGEELMVHPALLDMCFQTVIAAFCYPGDGSFWTPYLPTSINSIRVSPRGCISGHDSRVMTVWIGRAIQAGMNEIVGMYLQEVNSKRLGWYPPVVSDSVN
ncbi:polyketide synthase dehydratase-domain-containing protein [Aspergillus parasiticus]|uniref:Polyketide synthase dehydratase-domain-containing protein n=1 Tax=Aspergillus parasiticus TaxID=5067 RepID=A0A5N6D4K5_ASPPA|nr:polyketide synthase dehydratase-domain-containing protein [Aspergillus parasiticus]